MHPTTSTTSTTSTTGTPAAETPAWSGRFISPHNVTICPNDHAGYRTRWEHAIGSSDLVVNSPIPVAFRTEALYGFTQSDRQAALRRAITPVARRRRAAAAHWYRLATDAEPSKGSFVARTPGGPFGSCSTQARKATTL